MKNKHEDSFLQKSRYQLSHQRSPWSIWKHSPVCLFQGWTTTLYYWFLQKDILASKVIHQWDKEAGGNYWLADVWGHSPWQHQWIHTPKLIQQPQSSPIKNTHCRGRAKLKAWTTVFNSWDPDTQPEHHRSPNGASTLPHQMLHPPWADTILGNQPPVLNYTYPLTRISFIINSFKQLSMPTTSPLCCCCCHDAVAATMSYKNTGQHIL